MANTPVQSDPTQRLIKAARLHFLANGFRGVTMDELAEELGMSKKTLYACFPSKTDLVRAVLLNKLNEASAEMAQIARDDKDVTVALAHIVEAAQRHASEIQPPFMRDMRRDAPELFEMVQARRHDIIHEHFGKLLERGRESGVIRRDIPSALIIEILLGMVQSILNPPKMMELGMTPVVVFPAIMKVFLEGVLTKKASEGKR